MISHNYNRKQKQIYFEAFQDLSTLETALKHLEDEYFSKLQISILGEKKQFYFDKKLPNLKDTHAIKIYWKALLGSAVNFGTFYNPQMESVFIVGDLVSTFLHKINGKYLATLSSGAYGIFRGIGANEAQATHYLKLLNSGNYLLIVRGFEAKLLELDTILDNTIKKEKNV